MYYAGKTATGKHHHGGDIPLCQLYPVTTTTDAGTAAAPAYRKCRNLKYMCICMSIVGSGQADMHTYMLVSALALFYRFMFLGSDLAWRNSTASAFVRSSCFCCNNCHVFEMLSNMRNIRNQHTFASVIQTDERSCYYCHHPPTRRGTATLYNIVDVMFIMLGICLPRFSA